MTMLEKRRSPLGEPPSEKALSLYKTRELETLKPYEIDRIERKGVMRKGVRSGKGESEKGCVIYALLRCYSCLESSRVSFYYNDLPAYVRCQGCGQIYPFDSFGCWAHSNQPI